MPSYDHRAVEAKWQERWEASKPWKTTEDPEKKGEALYHLAMFPYPSGAGLHVGHVESYSALDILTRKARMEGKNVLFPIGWDAFGLPAENYAIKTGIRPSETTASAIDMFRAQMKRLGLSFDWSREISTADPAYYRWTQWLFLELYKAGLAYKHKAPVNWCPSCQTVLANEQVVNGECERCDSEVVQKELSQWFFKITDYADRLIDGLEEIDWPEKIKVMQRNWIGRSEGVDISFEMEDGGEPLVCYTTRPDTIFSVTFVVMAPEHPRVREMVAGTEHEAAVTEVVEAAKRQNQIERMSSGGKDKLGAFLGKHVINPATGERIPVYVANFALNYGTGVVMADAHDERDFEFARKYDIPLKFVISEDGQPTSPDDADEAFVDDGVLFDSGEFDGMSNREALPKMADWMEKEGWGKRAVNYRIRDWLVSRQRYWGAPIPIVYDPDGQPHAVKDEHLPLLLPTDVDYQPKGMSPIESSESFVALAEELYGPGWRFETDTMDTFVDSSWYYLRYCDPRNDQAFASKEAVQHWCPVDLYVGGAEHAVMHLLYARFFAYALKDLGYLNFEEPFLRLRNQGLILGPDGNKMSKSKGNVINPDDVVLGHGADALRMYEMFMGPLEDEKPWDTNGIVGVRRFLDKVWMGREKVGEASSKAFERALHKAIKKVGEDTDALKLNTAISAMMILANELGSAESVSRQDYEAFVKILAPYAPHLCEEIWEGLGNAGSVHEEAWPSFDPELAKDDEVEIAVQVNGKLRGTLLAAPDVAEADAVDMAKGKENVAKHLEGKEIVKTVFVAGRTVNFVVK